jgi:hypothetical protein
VAEKRVVIDQEGNPEEEENRQSTEINALREYYTGYIIPLGHDGCQAAAIRGRSDQLLRLTVR